MAERGRDAQENLLVAQEEVTPSQPSPSLLVGNLGTPKLSPAIEEVKFNKIGRALFKEEEGKLVLADRQDSTIETLLNLLSKPTIEERDIFHIFFLPAIHENNKSESGMILNYAQPLAAALRVDPFFFTKQAWDSNGFFMSQTHKERGKLIRSDVSRFLIKFLKKNGDRGQDERPDYGWLFLSFCAIRLTHEDEDKSLNILVCFDDCGKIRGTEHDIESAFKGYSWDQLSQNLLSVHDAILRQVIWQYDRALWLFRDPVRAIENKRGQFANGLDTDESLTHPNKEQKAVIDHYDDMHEYARHVIHSSETLQAASVVANKILDHFPRQDMPFEEGAHGCDNIFNGLQFSAQFLMNLKLRADAFKERLENEIQLSFNVVSLYHLEDTKRLLERTEGLLERSREILEQTRDDGKDISMAVTCLSLVFLPASLAALLGDELHRTEGGHRKHGLFYRTMEILRLGGGISSVFNLYMGLDPLCALESESSVSSDIPI